MEGVFSQEIDEHDGCQYIHLNQLFHIDQSFHRDQPIQWGLMSLILVVFERGKM